MLNLKIIEMKIKIFKRRKNPTAGSWRVMLNNKDFGEIDLLNIYTPLYAVAIWWKKPLTLKQRKYRLKRWIGKKERVFDHWWRMRFDKEPVYYILSSTDCDCVEVTSYGSSESYKEHYEWMNDESEWEWVEGRTAIDIISEEQWLYEVREYGQSSSRDRIMEAYENGRGNSVII